MIFDSNFECGNLDKVSIVSLTEYNLFLNVDTNTKGHSLWFYFAVTNTEKYKTVTFHILNCTKPIPLFKIGMRPLVFSEIEYEKGGAEWIPDTFDAFYAKNNIPKNPLPIGIVQAATAVNLNTYYTLTFSYTFKHSGDRVYFAYTRPYSVTMYCAMLKSVQDCLVGETKNIVTKLEEDSLQKRIREFVEEDKKKMAAISSATHKDGCGADTGTTKKVLSEEDQFKVRYSRKKPVFFPESSIAAADVLKEYKNESSIKKRFAWIKGQDFQVETDKFIYLQETLSHAFSGFPIELITITARPYLI